MEKIILSINGSDKTGKSTFCENLVSQNKGISGYSECGKSTFGQYFNNYSNLWNLKLKYFNEIISHKHNIPYIKDNKKFDNSMLRILLLINEINNFLKCHYYIKAISLESFHGIEIIEWLEYYYKNNFIAVFIDTPYEIRYKRSQHTIKNPNFIIENDKKKENNKIQNILKYPNIKVIDNLFDKLNLKLNSIKLSQRYFFIQGNERTMIDLTVPPIYMKSINSAFKIIKL